MKSCKLFVLLFDENVHSAGEKNKGKKEEEVKEGGQRTERTVDEIIASLRSQSRTGQYV